MSLFAIDEKKCTKCQACLEECPLKLVELKEGDSVYTPINQAEEFCIYCGHCVAVCPEEAFIHKSLKPKDCLSIQGKEILSSEEISSFLSSRRSIRSYKKKRVDQEIISKIIKTASYAPSGHNLQPVNWLVISEEDRLKKIIGFVVEWMKFMIKKQPAMAKAMHLEMIVLAWQSGVDVIGREAPHLIVASGPKDNPIVPPASTIALSYFELAAFSFGLGTCWAGYIDVAAKFWPDLVKELDLSEGHASMGAMLLGYPKFNYHRIPQRKEPNVIWG